MSSPKRTRRKEGKNSEGTEGQNLPTYTQRMPCVPPRDNQMLLFEYAVGDPSHLISGPSQFGPGDLDRLGRPYQPILSTAPFSGGQADFNGHYAGVPLALEQPPSLATRAEASYPAPARFASLDAAVAGNSHHSDDGSPAESACSSKDSFGYAPRQNTRDLYAGEYVSTPMGLHGAFQPDFDVRPWPGVDDGTVSTTRLGPESTTSDCVESRQVLAEPLEDSLYDHEAAVYGTFEGSDGWQEQRPRQSDRGIQGPPRKRPKKSAEQAVSSSACKVPQTAPESANAPSTGTKLRSASRTSKNVQHRPEETPRERKSRNSHNLVEKKYRNRLNLQFEILMNALPESMRSPTGRGMSGGGGPDGGGLQQHEESDLGERRLSKAQVLDMSATYIRTLEKEREKLECEREDLLESMRKLRQAFVKQGLDGGNREVRTE